MDTITAVMNSLIMLATCTFWSSMQNSCSHLIIQEASSTTEHSRVLVKIQCPAKACTWSGEARRYKQHLRQAHTAIQGNTKEKWLDYMHNQGKARRKKIKEEKAEEKVLTFDEVLTDIVVVN